jgi:hypothetical protein
MSDVNDVSLATFYVLPDPPALYRLGQYLREVQRDPNDRNAWIEWVADVEVYEVWQGLVIDVIDDGQPDN